MNRGPWSVSWGLASSPIRDNQCMPCDPGLNSVDGECVLTTTSRKTTTQATTTIHRSSLTTAERTVTNPATESTTVTLFSVSPSSEPTMTEITTVKTHSRTRQSTTIITTTSYLDLSAVEFTIHSLGARLFLDTVIEWCCYLWNKSSSHARLVFILSHQPICRKQLVYKLPCWSSSNLGSLAWNQRR